MADRHQIGSLEIAEDIEFQRHEWRIERAGWFVFALILLGGLLGVFGSGVLSDIKATSGPLTLEFERYARQRAPTQLRLEVAPSAITGEFVPIWLDQALLDRIDVSRIEPEPIEVAASAERVVYRIASLDPTQPVVVTISYEPADLGWTEMRLGLVNGPAFAEQELVYP